jgi:hypothetical protein
MSVKKYTCNICNKDYKSSQSLWNHKNKLHSDIHLKSTECIPDIDKSSTIHQHNKNVSNKNLTERPKIKKTENTLCDYCNNIFSCYSSLHRHLKICKAKTNIIKENEKLKKEMEEIKNSFEKFKKQMLDMMNKKYKMHPKTVQKMINNTNSNNNIIINNNNNNIRYIELGGEELHTVFSVEEVMNILYKGRGALDEIIVYTHLNDKYPQFQNIIIPNVRSKHAYMYSEQLDKYILCDKNVILTNLIDYRMTDLKCFYEEHGHKLNSKFRGHLETLFTFHHDKEYNQRKFLELNMTFYNQCNKDNIKYKTVEDKENEENEIDC